MRYLLSCCENAGLRDGPAKGPAASREEKQGSCRVRKGDYLGFRKRYNLGFPFATETAYDGQ